MSVECGVVERPIVKGSRKKDEDFKVRSQPLILPPRRNLWNRASLRSTAGVAVQSDRCVWNLEKTVGGNDIQVGLAE